MVSTITTTTTTTTILPTVHTDPSYASPRLNSVPFEPQDKLFLEEVQQTAAEFQHHTLETANNHYGMLSAHLDR